MPSSPSPDRNLLFGILALQMDFITRDQLVAAMNAWVLDKAKPLGAILLEQHALAEEQLAALDTLVNVHVKRHGNDPQKSLAALSSLEGIKRSLASIADPDVQASLVRAAETKPDPFATMNQPERPTNLQGSRFRILRPHARGGLGEVFVANDEELNREVALKEIQTQHADQPDHRSRFLLEAEITGGLEHPGIVPVYGMGAYADGRPFYAMRFIKGDSLQEAIRRFHDLDKGKRDPLKRSLALRELLGRFVDVCQAIAYAHSRGVLHRDLKPGNVMLGKYGETLVVDWGLAKATGKVSELPSEIALQTEAIPPTKDEQQPAGGAGGFVVRSGAGGSSHPERPLAPRAGSGDSATQMGQAVGTPAYMSPEQAEGRLDQLGPTCDVYSLGATLYHLLTGRPPFEEPDLGRLLAQVQRGEMRPPKEVAPAVPGALEAICLKAMAQKPTERYASALDLAAEIERWLADEPVQAHREPYVERWRRSVKRHRALATSAAVAAFLTIVALSVISALLSASAEKERGLRSEANDKAEEAVRQEKEKSRQLDRAEHLLYVSNIDRAQQFWNEGNAAAAHKYLDACRWDLRGWEHDYLVQLFQQNQRTLKGHTSHVNSVSWSPDGKRLASGSADNTVRIWDVANGQKTMSFNGQKDTITTPSRNQGGVTSVSWSPDGKRLACGGPKTTIRILDVASGQETLTLKGNTEGALTVSWSLNGKRLAGGCDDKTIKIWDTMNGHQTLTLNGHTESVFSVSWSPDGKHLASANWRDGTILWDTSSGLETHILRACHDSCVSWSPDGKRLATSEWEGDIHLWDATSGQKTLTLQGQGLRRHSSILESVSISWSPDGKKLVRGNADGTLRVWDTSSGQEILTFKGHTGRVRSVAWSPDGGRLATGSDDSTVKVWKSSRNQETLTLKGYMDGPATVTWSPDGKSLAGGDRTSLRVWNISNGQETFTLRRDTASFADLAWSPNGKWLASGTGNSIKVWDVTSGQETLTLMGHTNSVERVSWSPDGIHLASSSRDNTIKIWDVESGREIVTLKEITGLFSLPSWSSDGKRLASVTENSIKIWDAAKGQEMIALKGHIRELINLTWSPNSKRLASSSLGGEIKVWDVSNSHEIYTLHGDPGLFEGLSWSPDGTRLASGVNGITIKIWDALSGREKQTLNGVTDGIVYGVSWSPGGNRLASWSRHSTIIKIWDTSSGQETLRLKGHTDMVRSVRWSPDGKFLASGSEDHTIKVWDGSPGQDTPRANGQPNGISNVIKP